MIRRPSNGVIRVLSEYYKKYGHQKMKSREAAIVVAKNEQAFGIENYLRVISDKDYLELLEGVKGECNR